MTKRLTRWLVLLAVFGLGLLLIPGRQVRAIWGCPSGYSNATYTTIRYLALVGIFLILGLSMAFGVFASTPAATCSSGYHSLGITYSPLFTTHNEAAQWASDYVAAHGTAHDKIIIRTNPGGTQEYRARYYELTHPGAIASTVFATRSEADQWIIDAGTLHGPGVQPVRVGYVSDTSFWNHGYSVIYDRQGQPGPILSPGFPTRPEAWSWAADQYRLAGSSAFDYATTDSRNSGTEFYAKYYRLTHTGGAVVSPLFEHSSERDQWVADYLSAHGQDGGEMRTVDQAGSWVNGHLAIYLGPGLAGPVVSPTFSTESAAETWAINQLQAGLAWSDATWGPVGPVNEHQVLYNTCVATPPPPPPPPPPARCGDNMISGTLSGHMLSQLHSGYIDHAWTGETAFIPQVSGPRVQAICQRIVIDRFAVYIPQDNPDLAGVRIDLMDNGPPPWDEIFIPRTGGGGRPPHPARRYKPQIHRY